jgi:hypothetical protein
MQTEDMCLDSMCGLPFALQLSASGGAGGVVVEGKYPVSSYLAVSGVIPPAAVRFMIVSALFYYRH